MKKIILGISALMLSIGVAWATLSGLLIDEASLAHDATFTIDLRGAGVNTVTATAVWSTPSFSQKSWSNGQISTGTIALDDFTSLVKAKAINSITVATLTDLEKSSIVFPGFVLTEGKTWRKKGTTALTAADLASALDVIPNLDISHTPGSSIIYTTSPFGARYNTEYFLTSSSPTALVLASQNFLGGRDDATIVINGIFMRAGAQFTVGASSSITAESLKDAINSSRLSSWLVADHQETTDDFHKVTLASTRVGTLFNFAMSATTPSVSLSDNGSMVGAVNAAWALSSSNITIPAHELTTGLAALYTEGDTAISGLVDQTTYYSILVDANRIALASSKNNATAGTSIVLASSATPTAETSYLLDVLPFATLPDTGFKWQVSNDNVAYFDVAIASLSIVLDGTSGTKPFDLGEIGFRFLRANAVGPDTGGLALQVTVKGSNTF